MDKKTVLFGVASTLVLFGAGVGTTAYLYKLNKETVVQNKAQQDPEFLKFVKNENDYQAKVTSFNPNLYDLPKPNPSNKIEAGGCINGFGGDMPNIHKGMFNETLYSFDAEKLSTEEAGQYGYAPFVNAYVLVGDILFKKPLDLFDRKVVTTESLFRNLSDITTVVGNKVFKNSYATMESKFGFPQSYIVQQAGGVITFGSFNNECVKGVGVKNITFKKFNLSGLPVSSILSANYKTSLYHGPNGLYNHTQKSTDFVSESFLEWVQSNNRAYLSIVEDKDSAVFDEGSFIYIPVEYKSTGDIVIVDFKSKPVELTIDQIKQQIAKQHNLRTDEILFVDENLDGFKIIKFANAKTKDPLSNIAFAIKDGKNYIANWEQPDNYKVQGFEANRSNLVLINEKALGSALKVFKSRYQGKQLDLGTDNENLGARYEQMNSTAAQEELMRKREVILESLNDGLK